MKKQAPLQRVISEQGTHVGDLDDTTTVCWSNSDGVWGTLCICDEMYIIVVHEDNSTSFDLDQKPIKDYMKWLRELVDSPDNEVYVYNDLKQFSDFSTKYHKEK